MCNSYANTLLPKLYLHFENWMAYGKNSASHHENRCIIAKCMQSTCLNQHKYVFFTDAPFSGLSCARSTLTKPPTTRTIWGHGKFLPAKVGESMTKKIMRQNCYSETLPVKERKTHKLLPVLAVGGPRLFLCNVSCIKLFTILISCCVGCF